MDCKRVELSHFLRSRRNKLSPKDVGLPVTHRRRKHSLTQEDVAEAANISVKWYLQLESGLGINVSPDVLERVAQALKLNQIETSYLFQLANLYCFVETVIVIQQKIGIKS
ncbi:helix-turn-helix domain-containing protein [Bacillus sp. ISL-34]|uniref:helix-turn-helix domain-containing protein n=1 Tax=Bacillus sp. ISL-34 TaxID=2819121 RepID=UPI001BE64D5B|nr:helix-turn-helix transcriptional regulator [Bacillus sp. ISL-34]MBT2650115.1 helix-turn-helix domain-containing protein [Bacillus sp. ISL-34]